MASRRRPDAEALTPEEVMAVLRMKRATFYKHKARGAFDRFQLVPVIGTPRYSRKALQAYLDRELTTTR